MYYINAISSTKTNFVAKISMTVQLLKGKTQPLKLIVISLPLKSCYDEIFIFFFPTVFHKNAKYRSKLGEITMNLCLF